MYRVSNLLPEQEKNLTCFLIDVWRPLPDWLGGEQPYDLNSWQESETALALADTLDEDAVIVEGYAEYATWRPHLAYLRDPYGDPDMEMDIDGVGGVSILAKAKVFRSGVHFPAFSFEKHAETEGFGKVYSLSLRRPPKLTLSRWRNACNSLWWDCHIIQFGICTNQAWMISVTWRLVIFMFIDLEALICFRKWRKNVLPTRKKKKSVQSA